MKDEHTDKNLVRQKLWAEREMGWGRRGAEGDGMGCAGLGQGRRWWERRWDRGLSRR